MHMEVERGRYKTTILDKGPPGASKGAGLKCEAPDFRIEGVMCVGPRCTESLPPRMCAEVQAMLLLYKANL